MQRMSLKLNNLCARGKGLFMVGLAGLILMACNSNLGMNDNNSYLLVNQLVIEPTAEIPVLDGKPTITGIYIHNYSNASIQNIRYEIIARDGDRSLTINSSHCHEVKAHSSCLLGLTTPKLKEKDAGSSLLVAYFNGQKNKQLLNYRYVSTRDYNGINFSGLLSISETSQYDVQYVTGYTFGGNNEKFSQVRFLTLNNENEFLNSVTNEPIDIPANTAVPIEIKVVKNVKNNVIEVVPYIEENINFRRLYNKTELLNAVGEYKKRKKLTGSNLLRIVIIPHQQANLIMSNLPILNVVNESRVILTIFNNGIKTATSINATSEESSITISEADINPCSTELATGFSCNYQINLNNSIGNGSVNININYDNGVDILTATQLAIYNNNPSYPLINITIPDNQILTAPATTDIIFTINNTGGAALDTSNYAIYASNSLTSTTQSINANTCPSSLISGTNCTITVHFVSGEISTRGIIYLVVSGKYSGSSYSFASKSVSMTILSPPKLNLVNPLNSAAADIYTPIKLVFNQAMDISTLNTATIKLRKRADNTEIALSSPFFGSGDTTVTFQPASSLLNKESYDIVIHPNAIKSASGYSMGADNESVVSYFNAVETKNFLLVGATGIINKLESGQITNLSIPKSGFNFVAASSVNNLLLTGGAGGIIATSSDGVSWTSRVSGTTKDLSGAAVSPVSGVAVIVGKGGTILSSTDGMSWISRTSGAPNDFSSVAVNSNGVFVAVGAGGQIYSSNDGAIWTTRNSGTTDGLFAITAKNNTMFVAVGFKGRVVTSNDGITWTARSAGASYNFYGVTVNSSGLFVAVGASGRIITSSDGINWILQNSISVFQLQSVAVDSSGLFVLVVTNGGIFSSTNGTTWISRTSGTSQALNGITINNGIFIAVGNSGVILTSNNAISWTLQSAGGTSNTLRAVAVNPITRLFVAVGDSGTIITANESSSTIWYTRTSGTTNALRGAVINSLGLLVVIGDSGTIRTSNDGITWLSRSSGTTNALNGIAVNSNGLFVAVGYSGQIISSSDGVNWGTQTSGTTAELRAVAVSPVTGMFVAVGNGGTILTSSDGSNWTTQTSGTTNALYGIAASKNGLFTTIDFYGGIRTSSDGVTWVSQTSGTSLTLYGIAANSSGQFVVDGNTGVVYSSINGISWTPVTPYNSSTLYGIVSY